MNFVILYSALTQWYVSIAHVQFLAPVAIFILFNLRNYLRKKHRPPLPPSISEQFYVLSVVHFEWMWLIFSSFGNFVVSFCRIFQNYLFGLPYFVLIKYTCHLFFKSANNLFYSFTECLFDFYGNYIESLLGVYVVCTLRSIY